MKINTIMVSLVTASVLFTACGGGGGSGGDSGGDSGGEITSKPVIKLKKTEFNVIANQSKSIAIPLDKVIVNTDDGTSLYKYTITDNGGASVRLDSTNFGFLKYTNNNSATDTVKLQVSRDGLVSDEVALTFNVVDKSTAQEVKVLKTGQGAGDAGEDRNFTRNLTTSLNVIDIFNLEWLDNNDASEDQITYTAAKYDCENLGFRLATEDELLNLIDYNASSYKTYMTNNIFDKKLLSSWAEDSNGEKILISFTTGMRTDLVDKAQYRCVKGDKLDREHLIFTDKLIGDTYDLSTKLQWRAVPKNDGAKTFVDAVTYCSALDATHERHHTGWRVPTINELRSIVENNNGVPPSIAGAGYDLLSSTSVIDDGITYNYGLNLNWWKNEKPVVALFLQQAATINGTSYEAQAAGVTCVRTFTDTEVDAVLQ